MPWETVRPSQEFLTGQEQVWRDEQGDQGENPKGLKTSLLSAVAWRTRAWGWVVRGT